MRFGIMIQSIKTIEVEVGNEMSQVGEDRLYLAIVGFWRGRRMVC